MSDTGPPSITLYADNQVDIDSLVDDLGDHCVVKPATEGSAGSLYRRRKDEIQEAIEKVWDFDDEILVEKYVEGKELTDLLR